MVLEYQKQIFQITEFSERYLRMEGFSEKVNNAPANILFFLEIPTMTSYHLKINILISSVDEDPTLYEIVHDNMSLNITAVIQIINNHLINGTEMDLHSILGRANIITPDGVSLQEGGIPSPVINTFH